MSIFNRKTTIVLKSEQQRDAFIERLEKAHVEYDVNEDMDTVFSRGMTYYIRVKAADMKKIG